MTEPKQPSGGTPRTDALLLEINEGRTYKHEGVIANFARQLERELADAKEHAAYEASRADGAIKEMVAMQDELTQALAQMIVDALNEQADRRIGGRK